MAGRCPQPVTLTQPQLTCLPRYVRIRRSSTNDASQLIVPEAATRSSDYLDHASENTYAMLPFSKPCQVKASKQTILNAYVIEAAGLASDEVLGVVIDDRAALEQIHPTSSLALIPLTDDIFLSYEDALFYTDCFAYEHEIPAIVGPKNRFGIEFLVDKWSPRKTKGNYFAELIEVLEHIVSMRLGPLAYVGFRHSSQDGAIVQLDYTRQYGSVGQEVHLYALALRQIDAFSEYLGHYRVIESATQSNGLDWIQHNLARLSSAQFGMLPVGVEHDSPYRQRRRNLFTILRRRAVNHLQRLSATRSDKDIADRFYGTNRCGIAHGRTIRRSDFSVDFSEVYLDGFVVKLLARLAIEDKRSATAV